MTVLHSLYITLDDPKPPSVNRLYRNGPHGQKILSKEGEVFKAAMTRLVAQECMKTNWKEAVDAVYCKQAWIRLHIVLHLQMLNKSWKPGGMTKKGNPQSPYKKVDGTNYIKCIEDAVVDGTGIDDAAHLQTTVVKTHDDEAFVEIFYDINCKE